MVATLTCDCFLGKSQLHAVYRYLALVHPHRVRANVGAWHRRASAPAPLRGAVRATELGNHHPRWRGLDVVAPLQGFTHRQTHKEKTLKGQKRGSIISITESSISEGEEQTRRVVRSMRKRRLGLIDLDMVVNARPRLRADYLTGVIIDVLREHKVLDDNDRYSRDDRRVIESVCRAVILHAISEAKLTVIAAQQHDSEDRDNDTQDD